MAAAFVMADRCLRGVRQGQGHNQARGMSRLGPVSAIDDADYLRASTEAAFLAIVKENNVQEENSEPDKKKRGWWQWRKKRRDRREAARGLQLHDE